MHSHIMCTSLMLRCINNRKRAPWVQNVLYQDLSWARISRQSSAASRRSGYAKAAACSVCHVPHQSTVRRIEAVLRSRHGRQCHCCLCLTDPKKREVLLHLSREKKIEFQERIYNHHV